MIEKTQMLDVFLLQLQKQIDEGHVVIIDSDDPYHFYDFTLNLEQKQQMNKRKYSQHGIFNSVVENVFGSFIKYNLHNEKYNIYIEKTEKIFTDIEKGIKILDIQKYI